MGLSPEEKRKIYEEEKARIEGKGNKEKKDNPGKDSSSTSLKPNTASLLCYIGFWVTGIIFLVIERKNKLVRFHAMHSLVIFGIINIIWGVASNLGGGWGLGVWGLGCGLGLGRGMGAFLGAQIIAATVVFIVAFVLWWVLWAVLMYKSYHGTPFRVGSFTNLAEKCLATLDGGK